MRFAYEVYPRRVFILPQEMTRMAKSWHKQPQLSDLPPDPHEPYWHQFLPKDSPDPADFIRQHEINYVATFDECDLSRCSLEPCAMIGILAGFCVLPLCLASICAIGAVLAGWLRAGEPSDARPARPSLGWAFLLGSATVGLTLHIPLAIDGQITHRSFALVGIAGLAALAWTITGWWRNSSPPRVLPWGWLGDLPMLGRLFAVVALPAAIAYCCRTDLAGYDARSIYALKAPRAVRHRHAPRRGFSRHPARSFQSGLSAPAAARRSPSLLDARGLRAAGLETALSLLHVVAGLGLRGPNAPLRRARPGRDGCADVVADADRAGVFRGGGAIGLGRFAARGVDSGRRARNVALDSATRLAAGPLRGAIARGGRLHESRRDGLDRRVQRRFGGHVVAAADVADAARLGDGLCRRGPARDDRRHSANRFASIARLAVLSVVLRRPRLEMDQATRRPAAGRAAIWVDGNCARQVMESDVALHPGVAGAIAPRTIAGGGLVLAVDGSRGNFAALFALVITPLHLEYELRTSFSRLMLHAFPLAVLIMAEQMAASGFSGQLAETVRVEEVVDEPAAKNTVENMARAA